LHDWNAVLRRNDNHKWYGVLLDISADALGLPEAGVVYVLRVNRDPLLSWVSSRAGRLFAGLSQ
jgi:hypothetical protein